MEYNDNDQSPILDSEAPWFVFLASDSMQAVHSVLTGDITPNFNILLISVLSNIPVLAFDLYWAQSTDHVSFEANPMYCIAALMRPRWTSHIDSTMVIIYIDLTQGVSIPAFIPISLRKTCAFRLASSFYTYLQAWTASVCLLPPCSEQRLRQLLVLILPFSESMCTLVTLYL